MHFHVEGFSMFPPWVVMPDYNNIVLIGIIVITFLVKFNCNHISIQNSHSSPLMYSRHKDRL